jgi:hypothetical protein
MTSPNISFIKIISLGMLILFTALSAGCISSDEGKIVPCSKYHKIIDKHQTPEGHFIIVDGYPTPIYLNSESGFTLLPTTQLYKDDDYIVGEYVWWGDGLGVHPVNLTPLTEDEAGLRDACRIDP